MKPILFNTEMVQAILEGRKTMTRRVAKNIPEGTHRVKQIGENLFEAYWGIHSNGMYLNGATEIKCPYQQGWRPSIHMPKEAARIFLRVTDVRVERVQDIWMWVIEFERTEVEI